MPGHGLLPPSAVAQHRERLAAVSQRLAMMLIIAVLVMISTGVLAYSLAPHVQDQTPYTVPAPRTDHLRGSTGRVVRCL